MVKVKDAQITRTNFFDGYPPLADIRQKEIEKERLKRFADFAKSVYPDINKSKFLI